MNVKVFLLVAGLVAMVPASAFACQFDTDCSVGSTCLKRTSSLYGVCVGGLNPGNENDDRPVYNPSNRGDKIGKTCQFDTDCGFNRSCVKGSSSLKGTCM